MTAARSSQLEAGAREPAGRGRALHQVEQVAAQARQHGLRLRVAEADVELEHLRPLGGEHEPGVEHAVERRALALELLHHGLEDAHADVLDPRRVDVLDRRIRAHAARVGAGVALADALVVARRRERERGLAVAQREQRQLGALEELLDDDRDVAEALVLEHLGQRRAGLVLALGDHDALAGGEAVGLDHRGVARRSRPGRRRRCAPPRRPRSARRRRPSPPWRAPWSPPAARRRPSARRPRGPARRRRPRTPRRAAPPAR